MADMEYINHWELLDIKRMLIDYGDKLPIAIISCTSILVIFCLIILWNQRKIKKMLHQIQEQNACADAATTYKKSEK